MSTKLELHIDEFVKPATQPVPRILFGLREQVNKKFEQILSLNIIKEVPDGPSECISPSLVVPQGDGDVRVCVDMRRANEAIICIRKRHLIPTVEELNLQVFNGSTVFSKIDLKWSFHQILLSEDSQRMTSFFIHRGLYRYKWLFGVTSATEKYHKIFRDVLRSCPGVENIADDLIFMARA